MTKKMAIVGVGQTYLGATCSDVVSTATASCSGALSIAGYQKEIIYAIENAYLPTAEKFSNNQLKRCKKGLHLFKNNKCIACNYERPD